MSIESTNNEFNGKQETNNQIESFEEKENHKSIENLRNHIQLMELKQDLDDGYEIVDLNTEDKEVYYVPIEDGKWKTVKYKIMYIDRDNTNEIINLPITDLEWNIIRMQTITRYKPLEKPLFDPIDFIALGWGVLKSFLKWLTTLAPKTGINLSKTAIVKMWKLDLLTSIIWKEIPKEMMWNVVAQWFQE